MKEVISHIPITPRVDNEDKSTSLGYYAIPVLAEATARYQGSEYVLSLDDLKTSDRDTALFKDQLARIGLTWNDEVKNRDEEASDLIKRFISKGLEFGYIVQSKRQIATCFNENGCGKSEYLYIPDQPLFSEGKHSNQQDGVCSICKQRLEIVEKPVLLWNLGSDAGVAKNVIERTYPKYAQKEVADQWSHLQGIQMLVSRQRQTQHAVEVRGMTYNIDGDLINYLNLIRVGGDEVVDYFSSRGIIRQTLLMAIALRHYGESESQLPIFVFVPRVNLRSSAGTEILPSLEAYREKGITELALRIFLLQAFGNSQKEITLDTALIYHIGKGLDNRNGVRVTKVECSPVNMTELIEGVDYQRVVRDLVKKMKQPQASVVILSDQEKFVLLSAMGSSTLGK